VDQAQDGSDHLVEQRAAFGEDEDFLFEEDHSVEDYDILNIKTPEQIPQMLALKNKPEKTHAEPQMPLRQVKKERLLRLLLRFSILRDLVADADLAPLDFRELVDDIADDPLDRKSALIIHLDETAEKLLKDDPEIRVKRVSRYEANRFLRPDFLVGL
jgi:hypothetical protein